MDHPAFQPWRQMALATAAAAALALPAQAVTLNVSRLVLGTQQLTPAGSFTPVACGSACQYAMVTSTGMDNGFSATPGPFTASSWPGSYGSSAPGFSSVLESLPLPAPPDGQLRDGGSLDPAQQSRVYFTSQYPFNGLARQVSVQTWKTGSGASSASYAIRISTPADGPRHTYLEFAVPALQRPVSMPYTLTPSNQPIYVKPRRMQARAAVDVYADGLPLWSSESDQLRPQRFAANSWDGSTTVSWDRSLDDERVVLYLGHLPAGSTRQLTLVIRTDLRVDAASCRTRHDFLQDYQLCHSQQERLTLPARLANPAYFFYTADISVYTR